MTVTLHMLAALVIGIGAAVQLSMLAALGR